MRDSAFAVTGARVTGARRVNNPHHEANGREPNREWRITLEPGDGAGEATVALPATADCESAKAICTADSSSLSAAATASVSRDASSETAVTPLTARFADVPALHVGDAFSFELRFSESFAVSYPARDATGRVTIQIESGNYTITDRT